MSGGVLVRTRSFAISKVSAPEPAMHPPVAVSLFAAVMASSSVHVTPSTTMSALGAAAAKEPPKNSSKVRNNAMPPNVNRDLRRE